MSTPRDGRRKRDKDGGGKSEGRADKPQSRPKSKPDTVTLPQTDDANRQMYERTLYMTLNLVGRVVQVQVKSGAMYEGIFHTAQTDKGFGVVLLMARKKEAGSTTLGPVSSTIIIQGKDFVQMIAKDVAFDDSAEVDDAAFMTDTDISGHTDMRERSLQKWEPDSDFGDLSLTSSGSSNWDQFAVNEKLFGVKTSYEEELYTTKLDKGSHKYAEQARAAQRIADEIEGKTTSNAHLAEERGHLGSDDMDEEEKYSSVIRSGVYVPPGKRAQQQQQPQQTAHSESNNNSNDLNTSSELQMPDDGSPLSPSMTTVSDKQFTNTAVADRLKLRRALVNETHRISPTPAHPNNDTAKPQSPLHSPLVSDHKTITALGLEPRAPAVAEGVAREFLNFSLNEKAKQNPPSSRQFVTNDLKQFSLNFNKRPNSPAAHGSAPSSPGPASVAPAEASKPTTTPSSTTTPSTTTTTTTPAATTTTTTPATPSATPAAPGASTAPTLRPLSKLNPNAKAFTPMSANAPVFTPKGFAPAHPAPAPIITPVEHPGPVFFHPGGPMHHPHPPPHQPAPLASDPRPLSDIYCEAIKRKPQEKSEATQPYWFSTRGSYRTNVEDMDPNLRPQAFVPPPGAPPMGMVHAIPIGPGGPHAHALQPPMGHAFAPPPYVSVIPNAPMGMVMPMGPPPPGGPQGGPIFMGQPGMRPFHPGGPMPVGMAPGQPFVAYPPQMTPLSPSVQHQQPPHSPQPHPPQQPSAQSPTHTHTHPVPSPQTPPPHPQSPVPTHPHAHSSPTPVHVGSPATGTPPLGPKRAFYPHSPQSPHSPTPPHAKPGYTQPHS